MNPEQPIVTSENSDTILRGGLNEFQKRLLVQRHVISLMTGSSFEHDPNLDPKLRAQQTAAKLNWTLRYAPVFASILTMRACKPWCVRATMSARPKKSEIFLNGRKNLRLA